MDAFAVSIAAGLVLPNLTARHVFRLAFHFGLFQFMMPVAGWLAGRTVHNYISAYDHWVAFALLSLLGVKMLWQARDTERPGNGSDPTRGVLLVTLSVATSIDALAVGLSMSFLRVSIITPGIIIGLVAALLTIVGISFGSRIGLRFGRLAEACGGVVLLAIGLRILTSHIGA